MLLKLKVLYEKGHVILETLQGRTYYSFILCGHGGLWFLKDIIKYVCDQGHFIVNLMPGKRSCRNHYVKQLRAVKEMWGTHASIGIIDQYGINRQCYTTEDVLGVL